MNKGKKVALIIMDGWGEGSDNPGNAVIAAKTPFVDSLYKNYPHSHLVTSGEDVGLPDGQMGNSEVGHLNIGAGRVVYQELALINKAVRERTLDTNAVLLDTIRYAKNQNRTLHLMGLVSDGGVHSHIDHLVALCRIAHDNGLTRVFVHAFTDGRDTDPKSGLGFLQFLNDQMEKTTGRIASVIGRYYAMDRDKRWERVKVAYDLLVRGEGKKTDNVLEAVRESYAENITDEFLLPICCTDEKGNPLAVIAKDDAVICFNFRTDRCREITQVLTQEDHPEQGMKKMDLRYVTMTNYDDRYRNVQNIFHKQNLDMTLGEVLEREGKTQLRIAETEKYPHVTFFFSGGREKVFNNEKRIMIPSPKIATYDLQPSMSAYEVTDAVIKEMETAAPDFICLNYANADMVAHSGILNAAIEAVETVDACVKKVVDAGLKKGYAFLITADHGNADKMINEDGSPNTAHTTNPVPLFYVAADEKPVLNNGRLADIAPTVLSLMEIKIPAEMNGKNLIRQ
jgi:2,3-bisphosphoglycerate-independent phosphoglycerate mutase